MKKDTNLCMGCMKALGSAEGSAVRGAKTECPHCGYVDTGAYLASYLAPRTFLLDRYIVGKILSYNGESALYIGFDTELNRKVTIKEYMPDTLCTRGKDEELISVKSDCLPLYKTYLCEFIELNKALHKNCATLNIQTVLNVFTANNTAYAVFDYVQGITLKSYLANCGGKLSWDEIRELFPPLLTTMNVIHGLGIIHRAISPSTIFVTDKKELILIGFGITASRTADSEINCEVFSGYAPPEQYSSAERNGVWTDIFGICAVIYHCLTGVNPPDAQDRMVKDTLTAPIMINRSVPQNVSMVIMRGMRTPVDERIQSVNELVEKLFETAKPLRDNSAELEIPRRVSQRRMAAAAEENDSNNGIYHISEADRQTPGKTNRSQNKRKISEDKSAVRRKKKKKNRTTTKAVIAGVFFGVVVMAFVLAIIIPQFTDDESNTQNGSAVTTTSETSETSETSAENPVSESSSAKNTQEAAAAVSEPPQENVEPTYMLPDFKKRFFDSIAENAQYNYLVISAEYDFNNEYGAGIVFDQNVAAGTMVSSGTEIILKVSKGAEKVELPPYDGKTADEYKEILSRLSVKYETQEEVTTAAAPGSVIRCSKNAGDEINVADGEIITVYIAVRPPEVTVTTTTTTAASTTSMWVLEIPPRTSDAAETTTHRNLVVGVHP